MYGNFSEEALEAAAALFDFTRCVRPNGTVYGTAGKCRKGSEEAKALEPKKEGKTRAARLSKTDKIVAQVMGDRSLRSDKARIAEMVRRGIDPGSDFVSLVMNARKKLGITPRERFPSSGKSAAERMAAAAEKLEKQPKPKLAPGTQETATAASRNARPVDPKVAAKVNKAMAAKAAGPKYTPEQLAAQDRLLAESKSKPKEKKPKETPEEKAEKKWLAQKDKVEVIAQEHKKMIAEIEAQGHKVYATGTGADMLHRMAKERGVPTPYQLTKMRIKLRDEEPERIKKERLAEEERKRLAEIAGTTREQRKQMIRERIEELGKSKYLDTLKDVNNNIEMMKKWIEQDPSMDTIKNRVALTAMRAFRANMVREARLAREEKYRSLDEYLAQSPKYDKTPGSREPMKAKYDDSSNEQGRLAKIYEAQGFNAKPELVRSRSELEQRKDILRESDGRPLVLYRGVTEEGFARQFQGSGADGDKHFPGRGVYGNGTYAASAGGNVKESRGIKDGNYDQTAQRTAVSYASGEKGAGDKVTAFALRKDANLVQFEGETLTQREKKYYEWVSDIRKQAAEKFRVPFFDHGEAAAVMGIHAFRVPMNDSEDYWVILNRGAVIAAQDPQLPEL